MSWSNIKLLGVCGIGEVEREVAPMVNLDEGTFVSIKPQTINPRGTVGERKSRRKSS